MKLRNMSATVSEEPNITIQLESGEVVELENAIVLTSYASRVAVYCKMRVYLLPRYNYSVTTRKHVHAFVQDYCPAVNDYSAAGVTDEECEYVFASGIVLRSGHVERY